MKRIPSLAIIAAGCLWGTIGIFIRMISAFGISSQQITFFRALMTAAVLILFLLVTDPGKLRIKLRDSWCFLGTGLCSIVFFNICYFQTIMLTSLSVAAVLLYTAPVFVTILSAVLFREQIGFKKILALISAISGCGFVTGVLSMKGAVGTVPPIAILLGLGSGLGYAMYTIFGRYALRRYSFYTVIAYTFLFAAIGCVPFTDVSGLLRAIEKSPSSLGPLLLIGVFTSIIPYILYTMGLNSVEPGRASILASVEPVVATLIGVFFYHESLTPSSLFGIALVVAAIVLLNVNYSKGREPVLQARKSVRPVSGGGHPEVSAAEEQGPGVEN